jgi:hypothetical protein
MWLLISTNFELLTFFAISRLSELSAIIGIAVIQNILLALLLDI